jgi:hypothetical protein
MLKGRGFFKIAADGSKNKPYRYLLAEKDIPFYQHRGIFFPASL